MTRIPRLVAVVLVAALTAGCSLIGTGGDDAERTVTLVTHDSFAVDQRLLDDFARETGIRIRTTAAGDAGELTNKLALTAADPIGDVAYGVDSTFASRALQHDVFAPHRVPGAADGADAHRVDDTDRLTAVDLADVCVNVDTGWFAEQDLPEPRGLRDLADPRYRDLFAVPDPSTSSPGLAFLLASVAEFGEPGWQDYWRALVANGARISAGWEEAYNQDFSGASGNGDRPIVLSYATSPAAEAGPDGAATTRALPGTCYRQVEHAGVLAGADDPEAAGEVLDFLLSPRFQSQVAERMYVRPVLRGADVPPGWQRSAPQPAEPAELDPAVVEQHRDDWVRQWRELVRG